MKPLFKQIAGYALSAFIGAIVTTIFLNVSRIGNAAVNFIKKPIVNERLIKAEREARIELSRKERIDRERGDSLVLCVVNSLDAVLKDHAIDISAVKKASDKTIRKLDIIILNTSGVKRALENVSYGIVAGNDSTAFRSIVMQE